MTAETRTPPPDPRPALIDLPADPDPVNEPPSVDHDWDSYLMSHALWSDTWTDLEFGPARQAV